MREIKCRRCGIKKPKDEIFQIVHITSGGNKQNRNYCSEECYKQEQQDIFMLKQCQYFVDEVFGYMVINNEKNKQIKEIVDAGYSREELYNCLVELKDKIIEGLNYRQDITQEGNKIRYMFAIAKGNIKEITDKKKVESFKEKIRENTIDEVEIINTNYQNTNKRKSILDRLGDA